MSPDAGVDAQLARPALPPGEHEVVEAMVGRRLHGRSAAAVRCGWGLPAVLRVDPRLADGTPFPTTFWLTCPLARRAVGGLEAGGSMDGLTERVRSDPEWAEGHRDAHLEYVALRDRLGPGVPGDPSAGGMPDRVKCLHALYAHHLATGAGPVGRWVAEHLEPMACPAPCVEAGDDGPRRAW